MRQRDAWSRAVRYAKVLMPLGALAILSTLFLLSRKIDSVVDLTKFDPVAMEQTLASPRFAGVTDDGSLFTITARAANPVADQDTQIRVDSVEIGFDLTDGSSVNATAPFALVDTSAKTVSLNEEAFISTSTGYQITSDNFEISYGEVRMATASAIKATGPAGLITADQLVLRDNGPDESDYQMIFSGNVHMIYEPAEP